MPFAQCQLLDLISGQTNATTPATSTPSARIDNILLVKSIATTRNNKTPAAAQRSLPITDTGPEEAEALGRFFSVLLLHLRRYHPDQRHPDRGRAHLPRQRCRLRQQAHGEPGH